MTNGPEYYWSLERTFVTMNSPRSLLVNALNVVTFGRSSDNMFVLEGPLVSRNHLRFVRSGDMSDWRSVRWSVEDLGGFNGTYVNMKKIQPFSQYGLNSGDLIGVGIPHGELQGQMEVFVYTINAPLAYKMISDNYGQAPVQSQTVRTEKHSSPLQPPVASRFHTRMFHDTCKEPPSHTESASGKEILEKQIGRREENRMICIRFGSKLELSGGICGDVGNKEIITIDDSDEEELPDVPEDLIRELSTPCYSSDDDLDETLNENLDFNDICDKVDAYQKLEDNPVVKDDNKTMKNSQEKGDKEISPSMHDGRTMGKGSSLFQSPVVFLGIQSHLQSSIKNSPQHNQFLAQLSPDKVTGVSFKDRNMTGMKVTEYLAWKEGQMEIMDKDKEEQEKFLHSLGLNRSQDVAKRKFEIDLARELSRRKRTRTLEKAETKEWSSLDVKKRRTRRSLK